MHDELDPATYGLTIWDLDREFLTGGVAGIEEMKLGELLARAARRLLPHDRHRVHAHPGDRRAALDPGAGRGRAAPSLERRELRYLLERLNAAEAFEKFLATKYVGTKRFGLEGAESAIPILDTILVVAADDGLDRAVLGMAHRGRLNVLANIVGKSYDQIFKRVRGLRRPELGAGFGRREVPPRRHRQVREPEPAQDITRRAGRQPQPPRDGRSRRARHDARSLRTRSSRPARTRCCRS